MQKVPILGYGFYDVFTDSEGGKVMVATSEEDYRALALPDARQPAREGCTWAYSIETMDFDTPTKRLSEGEYAEDPKGGYFVYDSYYGYIHSDNV